MELSNVQHVALWAFFIAMAFGALAFKTNFCTMGAVSDWVNMGDKGRLRAWFLAIGIAILGVQVLQTLGMLDVSKSIYLTTNFGWLGHLVGGLCFGIGMTLGAGCGQRTLVRVGGGNLKSLVVLLVLSVTAYTTLRGLLALVRINAIEVTNVDLSTYGMANQSITAAIMAVTGIQDLNTVRWAVAGALAAIMILFAFKDREFRGNFDNILAGVGIGLIIVAGWYVTGKGAMDDFDPVPVESYTFVAPAGNAIQYLMTFTGSTINFGIAAVLGVLAGAFVYSVAAGRFRIETFNDRQDMINHVVGGALMGFGGVLSLGCTIGQGVTGFSTLAMGSVITLAMIIFGSAITMKVQYYRMEEQGFFSALFSGLADFRLLPRAKAA
jgi:uncharacterized membrane protein YedE/YeeE